MRLYVGVVGTEECFGALNGEGFSGINILATAVVALAGVAFGVFVGEFGALGRHDLGAGVVFRGNQLDVLFLSVAFVLDGCPYFRVKVRQGFIGVKHKDLESAVGFEKSAHCNQTSPCRQRYAHLPGRSGRRFG